MAIEDKLKYFFDSTMSSIQAQGQEELDKTRANLEADLEAFKKETVRELQVEERLETDGVRREMLKALSNEKLDIRRKQAKKDAVIKEQLFEEVEGILREFRQTEDYKELVIGYIKKAKEFAGDDEITIYLCPSDEHIKEELEAKSGAALIVSDVPFKGGIQAEIPSKNIFINESFSSKLGDAKRDYIVRA